MAGRTLDQAYLDKLFLHDIKRLGQLLPSRAVYDRLQSAAILRRMFIDKPPLVKEALAGTPCPLIVLARSNDADPKFKSIPRVVRKHAPDLTKQPGVHLSPCSLEAYLQRVLMRGHLEGYDFTITPEIVIKLLCHKLGAVHAERELLDVRDGGRGIDANTIMMIDNLLWFNNQSAMFNEFEGVLEALFRSALPLRDELRKKYGKNWRLP
jgi:hypothetical protein